MATASHNAVFPSAGPSSSAAPADQPPPPDRQTARCSRGASSTLRGRGRGRIRRLDGVRGAGSGLDDDVGMRDAGSPHRSTDRRALREGFARRGTPLGVGRRGAAPRSGTSASQHISIRGSSAAKAAILEAANQSNDNKWSGSKIDVLRKFLDARYDPASKLLDLSNIKSDAILRDAGISAPGTKGAAVGLSVALWKLCATHIPDVQSISLANNGIRIPAPFAPSRLASYLPHLKALSLADNVIPELSLINSFSAHVGHEPSPDRPGFRQLRELVLNGNPFVKEVGEQGEPGKKTYVAEVVRRFPTLESLDGIAIDPTIRHNLPPPVHTTSRLRQSTPQPQMMAARSTSRLPDTPEAKLPMVIQGGLFDSALTATVVASFLCKFFAAYDNDRDVLVDVYATESVFTLDSIEIPTLRTKAIGKSKPSREMPAQHSLDRHVYRESSRNLKWLKSLDRRQARLHRGQSEIVTFLKSVPKTKHPITESNDEALFMVDAWQMQHEQGQGQNGQGGESNGTILFVNVHGQFQELPSTGTRSFDRTFILGAAPPSSAAALRGWPCMILNDRLQIRSYSPASFFKPSIIVPTTSTTTITQLPFSSSNLTIEQEHLVNQLMNATKLNAVTALDCLQQNGWDPSRAMVNFQELHGQGAIPTSSFLT